MKIKKIMYYSVPRSESATCDCCGKSIQNICSITTIEDEHFNFGTTCFDKVVKDRLQSFQRKEMNKALRSIKAYCDGVRKWETMTEKEYIETHYVGDGLPWKITEGLETFEDYKQWMLNDFFPYRISEEEKIIARFSKIDF